jgi:hypothetical protein
MADRDPFYAWLTADTPPDREFTANEIVMMQRAFRGGQEAKDREVRHAIALALAEADRAEGRPLAAAAQDPA